MGKKSKVKNLVYKTPTEVALLYRKTFYTITKDIEESLDEWFSRIQDNVNYCDFGELSDVMFIDKFISGLNDDLISKFTQNRTLTAEQSLLIAKTVDDNQEATVKEEPLLFEDNFLAIEIKGEQDEQQEIVFGDTFDENDWPYEEGSNAQLESVSSAQTDVKEVVKQKVPSENKKNNDDVLQAAANKIISELKGYKVDENKRVVCLDCNKSFLRKEYYVLHRRIHTGLNVHQCPKCSKVFTKRGKLVRHAESHEKDNRSIECYLCLHTFKRFNSLKTHFQARHMNATTNALVCTYCKRHFSSPKMFDLHIKIHEGVIEAHQCSHCDRKFDRKDRMLAHEKTHLSGTNEHICDTCGRTFTSSKRFREHLRVHTGDKRQFKCRECGHVSTTGHAYKNHLRVHSGERPFVCEEPLCTKSFTQRGNLRKHQKVHRNEKPIACGMCDKRFADNYHWRLHQSVHTGARPYRCNMCDAAYTQPHVLRAHKQRAHPSNEGVYDALVKKQQNNI